MYKIYWSCLEFLNDCTWNQELKQKVLLSAIHSNFHFPSLMGNSTPNQNGPVLSVVSKLSTYFENNILKHIFWESNVIKILRGQACEFLIKNMQTKVLIITSRTVDTSRRSMSLLLLSIYFWLLKLSFKKVLIILRYMFILFWVAAPLTIYDTSIILLFILHTLHCLHLFYINLYLIKKL